MVTSSLFCRLVVRIWSSTSPTMPLKSTSLVDWSLRKHTLSAYLPTQWLMDQRVSILQLSHAQVREHVLYFTCIHKIATSCMVYMMIINFHAYTSAEGNRTLITGFGINGNGIDKVTRYFYGSRVYVQCTTGGEESVNASIGWYFANGTAVGTSSLSSVTQERDSNGTAVLEIGSSRGLTYCDGGMYTCVVNTTSGRSEKRVFHLRIGGKLSKQVQLSHT